jgi:predicted Rossmann fold flavoprotein
MKIVIIGGGAAGFFAALRAKEADPTAEVLLLEKTATLLAKVRISGGGRCNVTHACFDPRELITHYPRGGRELLGPFHSFQPSDTVAWFEERGVRLKTEKDGRMFPTTDRSTTIIDCLTREAKQSGVEIRYQQRIAAIKPGFEILFTDDTTLNCDRVILATGSAKQGLAFAEELGHTIVAPVPSLFTFNVPNFDLVDLSGASVPKARIRLADSRLEQTGALLITHWGFSGPAALKLSAWGARLLAERNYETAVHIDWLPAHSSESILDTLLAVKNSHPTRMLANEYGAFELPKKLWRRLAEELDGRFNDLSNAALRRFCERLKNDRYVVSGKTTHKEEFVTCGGVDLKEVDFRTMESRKCPGLFLAGEILNIDGVTGGFNFQNAWTTGWLAGSA